MWRALSVKKIAVLLALTFCAMTLWSEGIAMRKTGATAKPDDDGKANEPLRPIPLRTKVDPRKVALGKKLFQEQLLSHDNSVSCATCHDLKQGGTDRQKFSLGIQKKMGVINAPTVFNSSLNFKQFWDGRAGSL